MLIISIFFFHRKLEGLQVCWVIKQINLLDFFKYIFYIIIYYICLDKSSNITHST